MFQNNFIKIDFHRRFLVLQILTLALPVSWGREKRATVGAGHAETVSCVSILDPCLAAVCACARKNSIPDK